MKRWYGRGTIEKRWEKAINRTAMGVVACSVVTSAPVLAVGIAGAWLGAKRWANSDGTTISTQRKQTTEQWLQELREESEQGYKCR